MYQLAKRFAFHNNIMALDTPRAFNGHLILGKPVAASTSRWYEEDLSGTEIDLHITNQLTDEQFAMLFG